jgi:hypothetical protein
MVQFAKRKSHAEHMAKRSETLRKNGRADLIKPMEAYKSTHHRPDDAWRENKPQRVNGKAWKGAKGKQKKQRFAK